MSKTIVMALAGALAIGAFAAPAAEAGHKHRFFFKPYRFHTFAPVCGKWVWSYQRDRWVCVWWY